jgi:hypothetical protein
VIHLTPTNLLQEKLFKNTHLTSVFHLPVGVSDITILKDMLLSVNVMISSVPRLRGLAQRAAKEAPLFIAQETARGHDSKLDEAMLMMLTEGVISIAQSVNMVLSQVSQECETNFSLDEIVDLAIYNRVPTLTARYLPAGNLGPATLNGYYIRGMFLLNEYGLKFSPDHRQRGYEIKQRNRDLRHQKGAFRSFDRYMEDRATSHSLTMYSGLICPVSRNHSEGESRSNVDSGIDTLSKEFLRVFKEIRGLRKQGALG